ncbi:hypothetical protein OA57_05555 [Chelonobacter oris]|uniref:Uncharacterized protein n=1 Tax=Chelonobacter oris TaxID=505317 RepID=A0A0A3AML2_9PAST|nr:hypothetical protein OA57_05555 [Chelonobacter oris]
MVKNNVLCYRCFFRMFQLLIITLVLTEVGIFVYSFKNIGFLGYVNDFFLIQYKVFSFALTKGISLMIIGDILSGGFFKFIKKG